MSAEMNGVTPILQAKGLMKRYGTVVAMSGADFELMPGEICAVIGDNGAGKSTLIKALSGAVIPDHGEILLDGKPVHFRSPDDARALAIDAARRFLHRIKVGPDALALPVAVLERLAEPAGAVGGVAARDTLRPSGRARGVEQQRDLAVVPVERARVLRPVRERDHDAGEGG